MRMLVTVLAALVGCVGGSEPAPGPGANRGSADAIGAVGAADGLTPAAGDVILPGGDPGGSETAGSAPDAFADAGPQDAEEPPDTEAPVDALADVSEPDASPVPDAGPADALSPDGGLPDAGPPVIEYPPDDWGPYPVGARQELLADLLAGKVVDTMIWYPAVKAAEPPVSYLGLLPGAALDEPSPHPEAPFPIVLFSHGFRGIHVQSYAITERIASHGFVVVAPNHAGNTLFDFSATDEQVAEVALGRPGDMAFSLAQVTALSATPGHWAEGLVDATRVAILGHSFGGWTTLVVAGAVVDADAGQAQCGAGTDADIFCPYIAHWPPGTQLAMAPPMPGLKAAVALAPGGVASFAPGGLDTVSVPTLVMGGSLDQTTPLALETMPIYDALPGPRALGVIEGASHMSYTNICDVPGSDLFMPDFCGLEGVVDSGVAHRAAAALAVAWLRRWVRGEVGMDSILTPEWVAAHLAAAVTFEAELP